MREHSPSPEEMGLTIETEKPKKVFLEVGLSMNWKQGPLVFKEGSLVEGHDRYVGLDYRSDSVAEASSLAKEKGIKNALFVQGDAQSTPFGSETIDTIYFGNVFGGVYDGDNAPAGTRDKFIQEARRILKPTGRVIIFENLTPNNADDWGDEHGIDKKLEKSGFAVEQRIEESDPDWGTTIQQLGLTDKERRGSGRGSKFLVIAMPKVDKLPEAEIDKLL